jgi:signal transduction histidine kinase
VRLPDFISTTTFRWTLTISAVFVAAATVLVGFTYYESVQLNMERIETTLKGEIQNTLADPDTVMQRLEARLIEDPRRVRFAVLFGPERLPIAGNMTSWPDNFEPDGEVWQITAERDDAQGREIQQAHAVGGVLRNGNIYVVARSPDDYASWQQGVLALLPTALIPATVLALICGVILSIRTQSRIDDIHRSARRIMAGHLSERLPTRGTTDDFDKLVGIINTMLDQIEHLMSEVKGVGDDIAHDLRTPLTRVRASLERGRETAGSVEELRKAVDKGINGIDQALSVTTALLRIAAIEHGQRNSAFSKVDLGSIVAAIVELYEPAAEDKGIKLVSGGITNQTLRGDRDLLFEAISNLVDNAIKFTPRGGTVSIDLVREGGRLLLRVADDGPGIPVPEREAVFRRFYRTNKSRNLPGMGLGLSLVAAISRLHGFNVHVAESAQGCTIEMVCNPLAA